MVLVSLFVYLPTSVKQCHPKVKIATVKSLLQNFLNESQEQWVGLHIFRRHFGNLSNFKQTGSVEPIFFKILRIWHCVYEAKIPQLWLQNWEFANLHFSKLNKVFKRMKNSVNKVVDHLLHRLKGKGSYNVIKLCQIVNDIMTDEISKPFENWMFVLSSKNQTQKVQNKQMKNSEPIL